MGAAFVTRTNTNCNQKKMMYTTIPTTIRQTGYFGEAALAEQLAYSDDDEDQDE
jgi:hypothetical protein